MHPFWYVEFRMAIATISSQRVFRSTSCFVLGYGLYGRRIEWRYVRFDQIQDGGHDHMTWQDMIRQDKKRYRLTAERCRLLPNYFGPCKMSLA